MTSITNLVFSAILALLCITIHEVSHGYCAYLCGDDTAKVKGRLTFNPIAHIDPIGLLCLIIANFGWAKPVPVNPSKLNHRKRDMILVSLAGPFSNFLFALLLSPFYALTPVGSLGESIIMQAMILNVGLGVFNLVPIPPLDGSKVLSSLLPQRLSAAYYKIEPFMMALVAFLAITGILTSFITPIILFILRFFVSLYL